MELGHVKFTVEGFPEPFTLRGGKIIEPADDLGEFMGFILSVQTPLPGEQYEVDRDLQLAERLKAKYGARFEIIEHEPPIDDGPDIL